MGDLVGYLCFQWELLTISSHGDIHENEMEKAEGFFFLIPQVRHESGLGL